MRLRDVSGTRPLGDHTFAFTLAEVVISVAVIGVIFAGILAGYIQSARRAEWSGYSLAAEALSIQQLEQARAAVWDQGTGLNEITNLTLTGWTRQIVNGRPVVKGYSWGALDLPVNGGSAAAKRATNFVTVSVIPLNNTTNPPVTVQMVRVDTVWVFYGFGGIKRVYTNTTVNYFAPDNRDPETL